MKKIPDKNPKSLERCIEILENIEYKSYGFNMLMPYYYCKKWSVGFRNPINFSNPEIQEDSLILACHKLLDFIRNRLRNNEPL